MTSVMTEAQRREILAAIDKETTFNGMGVIVYWGMCDVLRTCTFPEGLQAWIVIVVEALEDEGATADDGTTRCPSCHGKPKRGSLLSGDLDFEPRLTGTAPSSPCHKPVAKPAPRLLPPLEEDMLEELKAELKKAAFSCGMAVLGGIIVTGGALATPVTLGGSAGISLAAAGPAAAEAALCGVAIGRVINAEVAPSNNKILDTDPWFNTAITTLEVVELVGGARGVGKGVAHLAGGPKAGRYVEWVLQRKGQNVAQVHQENEQGGTPGPGEGTWRRSRNRTQAESKKVHCRGKKGGQEGRGKRPEALQGGRGPQVRRQENAAKCCCVRWSRP